VRKADRQDNEEENELMINSVLNTIPKNPIGTHRIAPSPWRAQEKNEFIEGNSHGK